jgi:hypothetical protein
VANSTSTYFIFSAFLQDAEPYFKKYISHALELSRLGDSPLASSGESKYEWVDIYGDYTLVPVPETALRTTTAIFFVFTGVLACIAALWGEPL